MKQKLKFMVGLVLAAALLCGSALAAGETYPFEEWDMEVTVPEEDYYILLRDMDPESPVLTDVGLTAEQVNELLEPANVYLDALYYDASYELTVMVLTGEDYEDVFDYGLLSKLQRNATSSEVKRELEREGHTLVGDVSWYEGEEAVFAVMEMVPPDSSGWVYQYQTVYNGRAVAVTATSIYLDAPTDEIKEQTRLLAEGIHFTRKLPVPEKVQEAYEKNGNEGPSILMSALKGAAIGAVGGGIGFAVIHLFEKKGKKKEDVSGAEKAEGTGGDDL